MSIIHNTSVDFTRRVISEPVHITQGDRTLQVIAVELLADGQPYTVPDGAHANIALNKKDGTFVLNKADSVEGNIATFTVTAQMAAVAGDFTPEVQIVNEAGQATTGKFPYIVDKAEIQEGMIESTSEGTALISYVDKAEAAADRAQEAADKADTVAINTEAAEKAATDAAASATAAATSEKNAADSATAAADSATASANSATAAKASEDAAAKTLTDIGTAKEEAVSAIGDAKTEALTAVATDKDAAAKSATDAADSATLARSYARGDTATRDGEDTDNAKYYMEQAQKAALGNLDDKMSDTSENAVKNKVIKAYVDGHTPTLNEATDTASGLMSAADKAKLDGVDLATTSTAGLVKPDGTTIKIADDGTISAESTDLTGYATTEALAKKGDTLSYADSTLKLLSGETVLSEVTIEGGAASIQVKVTFDEAFKGAAYTITGGGESYSGTVPDSLQVIQKVKGYNTEYTIKSTVGGASFENTVSTGQYAGEYTAELSYFIATLTVAADISGATVTDKTTITITDGTHKKTKEISNSVSTNFSINFPGEWSVSMTNGTDTSTTVKVTISDNGQTASASISYFKATLTVKVINGNGATVTATDGAGHTYTGTATSGSVAMTVYAAGTYTVSSKLNGTAGYTTKKVEIKTNGGSYSAAVLQSGATFSAGSDEVIGAMIDAAQDGDLDLKTLWAVGDTRTITISSFTGAYTATHALQQIDIVITSFEDYNDSGAVMQFDMKDGLAAYERMNASNTGTYTATDMYKTVLPNYVNALPEWLRTRLHPFKLMVNPSGSGTNVTTLTNQKLALRSEWEVFGAKSYAVAGQAEASGGKQISYYATQANRIKKQGHTGSADRWWLRSPYSTDGFCRCNYGGGPGNSGAANAGLVAPFGCV